MEQDARETPSAADEMTNIVVVDVESYVNVELDMEKINEGQNVSGLTQGLCFF